MVSGRITIRLSYWVVVYYICLRVAPKFVDIQERVAKIIKDKILVGHRIWNFLSVGVHKERAGGTGFDALTDADHLI